MTVPSNTELGDLLGVSHATVSRWRSGDRLPEISNMEKIKDALGWSVDDQVKARSAGKYADEFSRRVESRYPVGTMGQTATTDQ